MEKNIASTISPLGIWHVNPFQITLQVSSDNRLSAIVTSILFDTPRKIDHIRHREDQSMQAIDLSSLIRKTPHDRIQVQLDETTGNYQLLVSDLRDEKESNLTDEELRKLAETIGVVTQDVAINEIREECFYKAYKLYESEKEIPRYYDFFNRLRDLNGMSLLSYAVRNREFDLVQKLISKRVGLHLRDYLGNSPLHHVVELESDEITNLLCSHFSLEENNSLGVSPFTQAIQLGRLEILKLFISQRLGFQVLASHFAIAIESVSLKCLDFFLEKLTELKDLRFANNDNLLHLILRFGRFEVLEHLLSPRHSRYQSLKSLVNDENAMGFTPISVAVIEGSLGEIDFLTRIGADLSVVDNQGNTLLHLAAEANQKEAFQYLYFSKLKDISKTNKGGFTPSQLATKSHHLQMSEFIIGLTETSWKPLDQPPENLICKGGGPKALPFLGAIEAFEKRGLTPNLKRIAGTSSGAIVTSLLSTGFTSDALRKRLEEINLETFLDFPADLQEEAHILLQMKDQIMSDVKKAIKKINLGSILGFGVGALWKWMWLGERGRQAFRDQVRKGGFCKGHVFYETISKLLTDGVKTALASTPTDITGENLTFGELASLVNKPGNTVFKHLYLVASRVGDHPEPVIFSSEDEKCKNVLVASGVRASMSIPFVFEPAHILIKKSGIVQVDKSWGTFIDGGVLVNYPIGLFDRAKFKKQPVPESHKEDSWLNPYSIGFSLYTPGDRSSDEEKREDTSLKGIFKSVIHLYNSAGNILRRKEQKWDERTIEMSNFGVGLLDFDVINRSPKVYEKMLEEGRVQVAKRLDQTKLSLIGLSDQFYNDADVKRKTSRGCWNLEEIHPEFVFRKKVIETLEDPETHLLGKNQVYKKGLWGLPGVGKSEVAIAFAYRYSERYFLVWKISAENEATMRLDYLSLAKALKLEGIEEGISFKKLQEGVHRELEYADFPKPWLLIFDNVEKMPVLPKKGGTVLITTRHKEIVKDFPSQKEVTAFDEEEAIELFVKITEKPKDSAMDKIVEKLFKCPLLIRSAAHIIKETGVTCEKYLSDLNIGSSEGIDFEVVLDERYKRSLKEVYSKSLTTLTEPAKQFLYCIAFFHPEKIPNQFIHIWLEEQRTKGAFQDQTGETIIDMLSKFGFIQRVKKQFSWHRLSREVILSLSTMYGEALKILLAYPAVSRYNPMHQESVESFAKLLPHCLSILNLSSDQCKKEFAQLGLKVVRYYIETERNSKEAKRILEKVETAIRGLKPSILSEQGFYPILGRIKFLFGMSHRKDKEYEQALQCFKEAEENFSQDDTIEHYRDLEQNKFKCFPLYQLAISRNFQAQTLLDDYLDKEKGGKLTTSLDTVKELFEKNKAEFEHCLNWIEEKGGLADFVKIRVSFDIPRIMREQARILFELGHPKEAIEKIENEVLPLQQKIYGDRFETTSTVAVTYLLLGDMNMRINNRSSAVEFWKKARKIELLIHNDESHPYMVRIDDRLKGVS